jgi:7-cyano-7-deazaguanine synthase
MLDQNFALVLHSGGQDSTTCLAWALDRFERVETIGFQYGQRHAVELDCRLPIRDRLIELKHNWRKRLGKDHLIDLSVIGALSDTALTRDAEISLTEDGLPTTFVPGRNIVFLTFAAMVAYRRNAKHIVAGMCETDYSGYPDCRDDTIKTMELAINLGMARQFTIHTPLMWIDKADTWKMAESLGGLELVNAIVESTHTCYLGERGVLNKWGHGCGSCPACDLRARGHAIYVASRGSASGQGGRGSARVT